MTLLDATSQYEFPSSPQGWFPVPLCRMPHGSHSGMHVTPLPAQFTPILSTPILSTPILSTPDLSTSAFQYIWNNAKY